MLSFVHLFSLLTSVFWIQPVYFLLAFNPYMSFDDRSPFKILLCFISLLLLEIIVKSLLDGDHPTPNGRDGTWQNSQFWAEISFSNQVFFVVIFCSQFYNRYFFLNAHFHISLITATKGDMTVIRSEHNEINCSPESHDINPSW